MSKKGLDYPWPANDRHKPATKAQSGTLRFLVAQKRQHDRLHTKRSQHRQILSNRVIEHDARLINLEIKLSFTEDMVEELNKALFRQQEQIDMLIREVDKLRQQTADEAAAGSHGGADEPPPHD